LKRLTALLSVLILTQVMVIPAMAADADIVVFNPDTVTDHSTYEPGMGALPSTGIPYVLVNGLVIVKDSTVLKVFPGKPIRFPVQEKGRLDQIEIEPRVFDPNQ